MARGINRLFTLTNYITLPIYRATGKGDFDDLTGKYIPSTIEQIAIEANIQPFKASQVFMLPEAERTKEWLNIWSVDEIRKAEEGTNGHDADTFEYFGKPYRVMNVRPWKMGVLDHYHAQAALDSPTPRGKDLNG